MIKSKYFGKRRLNQTMETPSADHLRPAHTIICTMFRISTRGLLFQTLGRKSTKDCNSLESGASSNFHLSEYRDGGVYLVKCYPWLNSVQNRSPHYQSLPHEKQLFLPADSEEYLAWINRLQHKPAQSQVQNREAHYIRLNWWH